MFPFKKEITDQRTPLSQSFVKASMPALPTAYSLDGRRGGNSNNGPRK